MTNGGWTDDGTVVRLTTATDQVGVGTATPASTLKMQVEGRARISLEDKGGEVFNVMAYGAKGDGTTNDAAAVNSAIAAAGGGAIIYFPPGTYLLLTTISWTDKTLMFIGAGTDVTTINSRAHRDPPGTVFTQAFSFRVNTPSADERVKPVVFRDMRIQFDITQSYGFDNDSILIRQRPDDSDPKRIFHGVRFENCLFRHYQVGLKLDGNSTAVIENCIFWSLRASHADVWVKDTVGTDSSTNMFRNCLFADPSGLATHAILTEEGSGGEMVIGCILVGYNVPIAIATTRNASSANVVIGNQMEGARYASIQLKENSFNPIIANNDLTPGLNSTYAIRVEPQSGFCSQGSIIGNHIAGPNDNGGILMRANLPTAEVRDWNIIGNNFLSIESPPIVLDGTGVRGISVGPNNYPDCPRPYVQDNSASPVTPSWTNYFHREEEFLSGGTASNQIGEWGWALLGGGTVALEAGELDHPGIVRLRSTAVQGNITRIAARAAGDQPDDFTYFGAIVRPPAGSTASVNVRAGLIRSPGTPGEGSEGIYWSLLSGNNPPNWRTITRNATGSTVHTTGAIGVYTAMHWYLIEIIRVGTSWEFRLNRTLQFTHTVADNSIPTSAVSVAIVVETTVAAIKELDVDHVAMRVRNKLGKRWT